MFAGLSIDNTIILVFNILLMYENLQMNNLYVFFVPNHSLKIGVI